MRSLRTAWSSEQIDRLIAMVESGASPAKAAAALGRRTIPVQNMARRLGKPFQDVRRVKRERLAREIEQLNAIEDRSEQMGHVRRPIVKVVPSPRSSGRAASSASE
jgi:hypothetical protein